MRRSALAIALCVVACGSSPDPEKPATDPSPTWARSAGNGASQFSYGIALGPDLVIATGSFGGTLDFGAGRLETPDGTTSAWVTAFDRAGKTRWSRAIASTKDASAGPVAIGAHVFVGGRFSGTITVGALTATSAGNDDAFLLELSLAGDPIRLLRFGDGEYQSISGLLVDDTGVTIAGDFGGSIFDLTSAGGQDLFVARIEGDTAKWSVRFGSTDEDQRPRIARDGSDLVVAASYQGSFPIGGVTLPDRVDGMVLFRLDEQGTPRWVRTFPGQRWQFPAAVSVGPEGRIAVAGRFAGWFESGAKITSESGEDGFVCTFTREGEPDRAARFGGFGPDSIGGVAFSGDDLYIAGDFSNAMGPLVSAGENDVFVARLDRDLAMRWSMRFGDASEQHATKLALDDTSLAIVGAFFGTMSFGPSVIHSNGGFEPQSGDAFVALFSR